MKRLVFTAVAALLAAGAWAEPEKKPLKVLMIGNSYSICVLNQGPAVAKSLGCPLDLCSLYIGGCPMVKHASNIANPTSRPYSVSSNWAFGEKPAFPKKANIPEMLAAEKWDVVTVQQASTASFNPATYHPYGEQILETIRKYAPQAEVVVQETWSDQPESKRLAGWRMTSPKMYAALHSAYGDFAKKHGLRVIPTGTAVEFARGILPLQNKNRQHDQHLNGNGHYLQALVWIAKLYGVDVTACAYAPKHLSAEQVAALKDAAMRAVKGEVPAYANDFVWAPPKHKVAVFGGSFSVIAPSQAAKSAWREKLDCSVKDYGIGGCGFFAGEKKANDVPNQVARALKSGVNYDIYVLWASTNDLGGKDVGKQNAGIEKSVALIREKAPEAKIAFFTSMPVPLNPEKNELLATFVAEQVKTCGKLGVPCLDLYAKSGITAENAKALTGKDQFHPNKAGYEKIKDLQADFLAQVLAGR